MLRSELAADQTKLGGRGILPGCSTSPSGFLPLTPGQQPEGAEGTDLGFLNVCCIPDPVSRCFPPEHTTVPISQLRKLSSEKLK